MKYCIKTQKDFTMGTLFIKGVEWKVSSASGKTTYSHRSIRISWDAEAACYQTRNHLGQVIFQDERPSVCLEDGSLRILEAYSQQYRTSWEPKEEEEIPIHWEEAEHGSASYGQAA